MRADRTGSDELDAVAEAFGIEAGFRDALGHDRQASPAAKAALLAAMGVDADDGAAEAATARWRSPVPPVVVVRTGASVPVEVVVPDRAREIAWTIELESGARRLGSMAAAEAELVERITLEGRRLSRRRIDLGELPWGHHRLTVLGAEAALIVTPGVCHVPDTLLDGPGLWGIAAQLYSLRSERSWGIGDFSDLAAFARIAGARGASVLGLNPLHCPFLDAPEEASPYSPASRLLLNPFYIDVTTLPEFETPAVQAIMAQPAFQARLEAAKATHLVDYTAVHDLKLPVLHAMAQAFRQDGDPERRQAFVRFCERGGPTLYRSCVFLALRQVFANQVPARADWRTWPEPFRDPDSPEVARFAADHGDAVAFMLWLQWVADDQLARAAEAARAAGMAVGLYCDLAVGCDRAGAETWADPSGFLQGAQVGAPPDIFNPAGQSWGLPPPNPLAMRATAYRGFVELLRAAMRRTGALRIDHVMALFHLYCIPDGVGAGDGAYLGYPLDDLLGILALESRRHRCFVVGEDLGTVPPGLRERLAAAGVLSYRVLFFEQDETTGIYAAPHAYPRLSLAVAGSQDLPTLPAWWEGLDIDLKDRLGLYPSEEETAGQRRRRERDRGTLLDAFAGAGLAEPDGTRPAIADFTVAAQAFLARSGAGLVMVQVDDMLGETEPVNIPGTSGDTYPNWRRIYRLDIEAMEGDEAVWATAAMLREERPRPAET